MSRWRSNGIYKTKLRPLDKIGSCVSVGLTGSSSGGAFPECVLEGNFSHVLAQFLSFVCMVDEQRENVTIN